MRKKILASMIDLNNRNSVSINDGKRARAYFCKKWPLKVDRKLIEELKAIGERVAPRNVRLCLHSGPEALFHEMIILERKGGVLSSSQTSDKRRDFSYH